MAWSGCKGVDCSCRRAAEFAGRQGCWWTLLFLGCCRLCAADKLRCCTDMMGVQGACGLRVVLAVRGGLCRDYVQGLCRVQGVTAVAQHTVCAVTIS